MKRTPILAACVVGLLFSSPAAAASFVVPADEFLIDHSDAIVLAIAGKSSAQSSRHRFGVVTVTEFTTAEFLKGNPGATFQVAEPGGSLDDLFVWVPGSPRYFEGERVLLFLERTARGWRAKDMILGVFRFLETPGEEPLLFRDLIEEEGGFDFTGKPYNERLRKAGEFLQFVRSHVRGERITPDYFFDRPISADAGLKIKGMATRTDFLLLSGGQGVRWPNPSASFRRCDGAPCPTPSGLNGDTAITTGMALWNNESTSNVSYSFGGTTTTSSTTPIDTNNVVIYNDPNGEVSGTFGSGSSVLGVGSAYFGATHTVGSETFFSIIGGDVVMNDGVSSANVNQQTLNATLCHELGHTLGFRHSNESGRTPQSNAAIMRSSIPNPAPTSLTSYDLEAVQTVYGSGPTCTPPSISSQPQSQTITSGNSANLSVSAGGTSPFTFQWFRGNSGDTGQPVAGGTSSTLNTGPLTATTSFWVRVTGQCAPTVNSSTATITVNPPPVCTPPGISQQPAGGTLQNGGSTTLVVIASGTGPFSFQWFRGSSGDTGQPIPGATGSTFTTGPLNDTTSFWVRVIGQCSPPANSNTATVTVLGAPPCTQPNITSHPQGNTIQPGQSVTLLVSATGTGPLTFQWFRGSSGNESQPIAGATSATFNTGPLTSTTSFWVKVRNTCGSSNSFSATVTVAGACPAGTLCLLNNRFHATVTWRDSQGNTGIGNPEALTSDSGYFWFFAPSNIELVFKVLNGCAVSNRVWVFAGGLTNVEVQIAVRDTATGVVKNYTNPLSTPFQPIQDTNAFASCGIGGLSEMTTEQLLAEVAEFDALTEITRIAPSQNCVPTDTALCLNANRFRVEVNWFTAQSSGPGHGVELTDDSGYFWFFNPANIEMVTKVLNGCNPFNSYWVFAAGLTNVRVEWSVTDTHNGLVKRYTNPLNTAFLPVQDTSAFATCP